MSEQTIFVDRTTTWGAIGQEVNHCKNMEQVLQASGLDYTVEKKARLRPDSGRWDTG